MFELLQARRRGQRRRPLRDDGHGDRRGLHEHPGGAHDGRRDQRHDRREHPARRDQARAPALSRPTRPRPIASSGWASRPPPCTSSAARASTWCARSPDGTDGMPHAELAGPRGRRRAHRRQPAVPAGQPASGDDRVRPGQGSDLGDADGARRAADADHHAVAQRRRRVRGHRHRHADVPREAAAGVHPLLQELPDRDLRAPDAARAPARSATPARRSARARSSACRRSTSARGRRAATAGPTCVDVGYDRARDRGRIRRAARARPLSVRSRSTATARPARASPTCSPPRRCRCRSGWCSQP